MSAPLWVADLASEFWSLAGGPEPFPRRLRDHIRALHEAAGKLARRDVFEHDVVWQVAEERHAAADQHGHARDNQSLNEPRQKKPLN